MQLYNFRTTTPYHEILRDGVDVGHFTVGVVLWPGLTRARAPHHPPACGQDHQLVTRAVLPVSTFKATPPIQIHPVLLRALRAASLIALSGFPSSLAHTRFVQIHDTHPRL